MKLSQKKILKALRLSGLGDDDLSYQDLRKVIIKDEKSYLQIDFILDKSRYTMFFGQQIDSEILDDIWPDRPNQAELLTRSTDLDEEATDFLGKKLLLFRIPPTKVRLDIYLASEFDTAISRSRWQKYILAGHVYVNGQIITSPKTEVSSVDIITVRPVEPTGEIADISVLYQDEDVVVIDKPAGVLTHAKGGIVEESTIADFFAKSGSFSSSTDRPGIVHRLDRDTSGVMIGARTEAAEKYLKRQFADRKVEKTYLAVVQGHPKLDQAKIDLPIARNPVKPSTFKVDPRGKPAETFYEVIGKNGSSSLVVLKPRTGRTHQLRVHMAYLNTPIVGDRAYGKLDNRLMLHAYKLQLTLPSGQEMTFTSSPPAGFLEDFPEAKL